MYPTQHAAISALSVIPLRVAGWSWPRIGLFTASAVLIDVDHYLSYVWRTGDISLLRAYEWYVNRVQPKAYSRPRLYRPVLWVDRYRPFHALGPLLLLLLLAYWVPLIRPIAWGAAFHRLQDYSMEVFERGPGVPVERP